MTRSAAEGNRSDDIGYCDHLLFTTTVAKLTFHKVAKSLFAEEFVPSVWRAGYHGW